MNTFGDRLKLLRKSKKLKQTDVAKFLNISSRHYQDMEYGKINIPGQTLITIADFFDVSVDYLVGNIDTKIDPLSEKTESKPLRHEWHFTVDFRVLQSSLSTPEKFLYMVLRAFVGPYMPGAAPSFFPSNEKLSLLTGYPIKKVLCLLKSLKEKKILSEEEIFDELSESNVKALCLYQVSEEFLIDQKLLDSAVNEEKRRFISG